MTPAADKPLHRTHAGDDRCAGLNARVCNVTGQPEEFEYKGTFHVPLGMVNGVTTFGFGEIAVDQDGGSHSWGVSTIARRRTIPELKLMIHSQIGGDPFSRFPIDGIVGEWRW